MKPFNWKDVDLNLLVAFQALYQTNSVSLAAQQCFVSQSAMSHTLQRMRKLFDDPLFTRVGIHMEPTARSHSMAPLVDNLLAKIKDEVLVKPSFTSREYTGTWKIGLTDYAEQIFAPGLYDTIKERAPASQVSFYNVNRGNYKEMVEKEQIDLVVGSIANLEPRFFHEKLYTETHLCLFDPEEVAFRGEISIGELVSVEHALVSPDGNLSTQLDEELKKEGYQRRVSVASRNFLTIRRLLLGRKLICIVPKKFAETQMYSHSLMAVKPPLRIPDFDINMIVLKTEKDENRNQWLRKTTKEAILRIISQS